MLRASDNIGDAAFNNGAVNLIRALVQKDCVIVVPFILQEVHQVVSVRPVRKAAFLESGSGVFAVKLVLPDSAALLKAGIKRPSDVCVDFIHGLAGVSVHVSFRILPIFGQVGPISKNGKSALPGPVVHDHKPPLVVNGLAVFEVFPLLFRKRASLAVLPHLI